MNTISTKEDFGQIKHGVDGWGLEIYTRVEEADGVYGEYLYENEKTREVRKITRYLGRRPAHETL